MRVAIFVDKPLPSDRPTGVGIAAFSMSLALSRRGIEVDYVCRGNDNQSFQLNDSMSIYTIHNYSRDNLRAAISLIKKERPSIVHVHSSTALPALIFARVVGRPIAMHSHGDEPLHPLRPALMRRIGMDWSHRIVAISEATRRDLIARQHLSPGKVAVAYNGVDADDFRPLQGSSEALSRYGLTGFERIILSVGTVQKRKGQWRILRCLPAIIQEWPNLVYVNIGRAYDAVYQSKLIEEVEMLGVSQHVRFLTDVPHEDLVSLMNFATVCVHLASREGFGLAVVEEMACGKPVIALNIEPMPEIIDRGIDGELISPDDPDDLRRCILRLLEDDSLRKRLGDSARTKVKRKFTWDQTAARLEVIYAGLKS